MKFFDRVAAGVVGLLFVAFGVLSLGLVILALVDTVRHWH